MNVSKNCKMVKKQVNEPVKWPHKYVLLFSNKEHVSYDQLSFTQWLAGFCCFMREDKNSEIKDHMLDYFVDLLDDANDFSWDSAKTSHVVLLFQMEQGEVASYA